jgi:hypothetical protein
MSKDAPQATKHTQDCRFLTVFCDFSRFFYKNGDTVDGIYFFQSIPKSVNTRKRVAVLQKY